jgi:hypothetical protein
LQQSFLPSIVPNEQAQPMVSKFCTGALSKVFVSNAANILIYNNSKQYRKSGICIQSLKSGAFRSTKRKSWQSER